ncbi:sensor histidine kinase [Lunatimonas salinarum]|uniref:sensor histidine kinase n=1 Tax=Lunatimonas salinarum TaxID=1774590 RepID=UPI001FD7C03E|nr:ATP-binding protein [Lunatimonas salinarum]
MATDDISFELFIMLVAGIVGLFLMATFVVSMVLIHRQRQLRNQHKIELLKAEYQNTLLNAEKEIREDTLHYVSQELHDNIGQMLSLTKLVLSNPDPSAVSEGRQLINSIIKEVRSLSKSINRDYIKDVDFGDFLLEELEKIERSGFCKTKLTRPESRIVIGDANKKLILIRLVQECLNNAIKHAEPSTIEIDISQDADRLLLEVTDDGKGFDKQLSYSGLGLRNLQSRMEAIEGKLDLDSSPGVGTRISMSIVL